MPPTNVSPVPKTPVSVAEPFWPNGWWRLMELRVGVIPLPVYVLLVALILVVAHEHLVAIDRDGG